MSDNRHKDSVGLFRSSSTAESRHALWQIAKAESSLTSYRSIALLSYDSIKPYPTTRLLAGERMISRGLNANSSGINRNRKSASTDLEYALPGFYNWIPSPHTYHFTFFKYWQNLSSVSLSTNLSQHTSGSHLHEGAGKLWEICADRVLVGLPSGTR